MQTQTSSRKYEGQCKFCEQSFTKRQIADHLDTCPKRKKSAAQQHLRLRIIDPYSKNFWLIVEVNKQAKFKDLDKLIRDVWVECCGHLSSFGGYDDEVSKGSVVMDTLNPGDAVDYVYDFGSSTELAIEALQYSDHQLSGDKNVELVARNYLPPSNCLKCDKQAEWVCAACENETGMVLACDECAKKHHNESNQKEEHYLLSLANSPRCGVCGYEQEGHSDQLF